MAQVAHPPETLEGWYALHQMFAVDRRALRTVDPVRLHTVRDAAADALEALAAPQGEGWSIIVPLVGTLADVMLVHFRSSLEELAAARERIADLLLFQAMRPTDSFLSVTEAGLYHITAELAREARERGGEPGDEAYVQRLAERSKAEESSAHVRRRLYPERPADMPYVCFYPMSKRREAGQNWYTLTLDERSRLMYAHGATGRRYAGRILQVVTGAIGLDAWEWGVTLFAKDPLDFKRIVTDMRFDEVSAKYAEFGDFYVGKIAEPRDWVASLFDWRGETPIA